MNNLQLSSVMNNVNKLRFRAKVSSSGVKVTKDKDGNVVKDKDGKEVKEPRKMIIIIPHEYHNTMKNNFLRKYVEVEISTIED